MNLLEPFEGTIHIEEADMKKLVKALEDINIKDCPYFDVSDKYGNSARYYRGNQWIPVSERLPEESGAYVCSCNDTVRNMVTVIKWQPRTRSWNLTGHRTFWKVEAWMPLPEPYGGEQDG